MLIYILIGFILIVFCASDLIKMPISIRNMLFAILFIIIVLFVGVRNSIGSDWYNYVDIYETIAKKAVLQHRIEYGYITVNWVFARLGFGFNSLIFFIAFFSLAMKFLSIRNVAPLFFIPIMYYLSYYMIEYEMSGVRQSIAMGFAFVAIVFVRDQKLFPFMVTIIGGALFHVSILFFIPIFFLGRFDFTVRLYFITIACALALMLVNISQLLLDLVLLLPMGAFITEKITSYMLSATPSSGLTFGHIPYILFGLLFVYYRSIVNLRFYNLLLNGFIVGVFFSLVLSGSTSTLNRLTYYYLMLGGILFSYILAHTHYITNKIALYCLLSFFIMLKFIDSVVDKDAAPYYVPYKTIATE